MQDPFDPKAKNLLDKLQRARRHATFALILERLSAQSWRLLTWVLLFAGIWLFSLQDMLGQSGGIAAFALFILGVGVFVYRDLCCFKFPDSVEIDRRIEQDSALLHRPINALMDSLANARKIESRELWALSKKRAMELLVRIRPVIPKSLVLSKDPYALRFAVLLFFGIGLITAGADWRPRLAHGLAPFAFTASDGSRSGIRLIITPPEYTALQQLVLEASNGAELQIPEGSMLKATVHGGIGVPRLKIDGVPIIFEKAGDGNYILELAAPQGRIMRITQLLFPRATWNYTLLPDEPPKISMKENALKLPEGSIRVPLTIQDDYGATIIDMHMELADDVTAPPLGRPITITRSAMTPPKTPVDINPIYDLTSHPWAGLPVKLTFVAEDHLKQKSATQVVNITLPERVFTNSLAKVIVGLRKDLIAHPLENYPIIEDALENIMAKPDDFRRDNLTLLALRTASSRLYWAGPSLETGESVAALLWDTALRIEDGNLSMAARNLREAQTALENALRNPNTSSAELAQLMADLRMAMAQYFMELQSEMQRRAAEGKPMPFVPGEMLANMITPEGLAGMLEQMESQMMSGDKKSAQQMLNQLRSMMDMMSPSMASVPPEIQQMIEIGQQLQKIIQGQQSLLDDTSAQANLQDRTRDIIRHFGQALPPDPGLMKNWGIDDMPPPPHAGPQNTLQSIIDTRENQKQQENLRYQLGQLMSKIGETMKSIPENFGQAEQEMRESSKQLGEKSAAFSIPHQQKVLEYLKQGQQQMQKQMAQMIQKMTGMAIGSGGMRYDPLGRPYGQGPNEGGMGSTVKIPDEAERKQAQEILRLIQKRAGEYDRPQGELEYYRRLLRQF